MELELSTRHGTVALDSRGGGSPLLLLHGNPGDRRDWEAVVPALAATHRVIRLDWPGHGASAPPLPPRAASAMLYAEVLADVAAALDLREAMLAGHSVGGYAALRLALEHPARVGALVLVAPGGFTAHTWKTRAFCRIKGREWVTRWTAGAFARRQLRRHNPTTRAMIARAEEEGRRPGQVAVDAAVWRSFVHPDHDLRGRAGTVTQPVLLVWGRHDPVLGIEGDGRNARCALPHASWVELETGHAPFAEDPESFLAAVRSFVAAHDAMARPA